MLLMALGSVPSTAQGLHWRIDETSKYGRVKIRLALIIIIRVPIWGQISPVFSAFEAKLGATSDPGFHEGGAV
jgi:hypothetical protein